MVKSSFVDNFSFSITNSFITITNFYNNPVSKAKIKNKLTTSALVEIY